MREDIGGIFLLLLIILGPYISRSMAWLQAELLCTKYGFWLGSFFACIRLFCPKNFLGANSGVGCACQPIPRSFT
ncbi:hypothetical protein BGX38DRAFT_1165543 [Terfezia claveryi]|nr:hypothetical protein BGX38DRAFT_1165543 [Terfezia claveryi]